MKLYELSPAEVLARREEFEPQISQIIAEYGDDKEFILRWWTFRDIIEAFFYKEINVGKTDCRFLGAFYVVAYWRAGFQDLPEEILEKRREAQGVLSELRKTYWSRQRAKKEAAEKAYRAQLHDLYEQARQDYLNEIVSDARKLLANRCDEFCATLNFVYGYVYNSWRQEGMTLDECRPIAFVQKAIELLKKNALINRKRLDQRIAESGVDPLSLTEIERLIDCIDNGQNWMFPLVFRGRRITWKIYTETKREPSDAKWGDSKNDRVQRQYTIVWNAAEYEQEDFFKAAFGDKYKLFPMKARFNNSDVRLLSRNQWVKLQYLTLAANFKGEVPSIDVVDAAELQAFYAEQANANQSFGTKAQRMNWFKGDGLRYMVAFGQGHDGREKEPTDQLFCYKQAFDENTATYSGRAERLVDWVIGILSQADLERAVLGGDFTFDDCKTIYDKIQAHCYYQNGYYMTFPYKIMKVVNDVVKKYVSTTMNNRYWREKGGKPLESLSEYVECELGEYRNECAAEYEFYVRLKSSEGDVEIVENVDLRKNMSDYNKTRGAAKMAERAAKDLSDLQVGEKIKLKDLIARGYSKPSVARLVKAGILEKIIAGVYVKIKD